MKKVLVVGNASSVWTKEYIKNIHIKHGNCVWVTCYNKLSNADEEFYNTINVKFLDLSSRGKFERVIKYYGRLKKFLNVHKSELDIVDIQGPPHSWQADIIYAVFRKSKARIVTTFWGSDILQIGIKDSKHLEKILNISRWINIGTSHMHDKLREFYGNRFDSKCTYIGFGSPALTYIRECRMSKRGAKEQLGLDPSKEVIAVGYNGRQEQQHIKAIESVDKLPSAHKLRVQLLIHIGYNTETGYKEKIIKSIEKTGLAYLLMEDMLDLYNVAIMRIATDIFIHAQTSDGLSGSVREAVYAGATLLNPVWIRYDKFDKDGVEYVKYTDFQDLTTKLKLVLDNIIKVDKDKNREVLYNEYSWEAVEHKWMRMFDD
ncbi:MAG: hypothetical protein MR269_06120 [Clostridiales bacterium]|nr:hypothetical protein [Clostridiales bacterium]